jgi:hypothetical protein
MSTEKWTINSFPSERLQNGQICLEKVYRATPAASMVEMDAARP